MLKLINKLLNNNGFKSYLSTVFVVGQFIISFFGTFVSLGMVFCYGQSSWSGFILCLIPLILFSSWFIYLIKKIVWEYL